MTPSDGHYRNSKLFGKQASAAVRSHEVRRDKPRKKLFSFGYEHIMHSHFALKASEV